MKKYHVFILILIGSVILIVNTAEALSLKLLPNVIDSTLQTTFTLDVKIEGVSKLGGFQFDLNYDSNVLGLQSYQLGAFPGSTGRTFMIIDPPVDDPPVPLQFGTYSTGTVYGPSGDGIIAQIIFNILDKTAISNIAITRASVDTQTSSPNLDNAKAEVAPYYTITASTGPGGSISPSGSFKMKKGLNQTFTITPAACYHIKDVQDNGVSKGAVSQYPISDIKENHTIYVSFEINTYTIQASAGTVCSITPSGNITLQCGQSQTFTIKPEACFHIADVKVDNVSQGKIAEYPFPNVNSNHTIQAECYPSGAGDINGDDSVDLKDAIPALQILSGLTPPGMCASADVNGDGKIGIEEAVYILQKITVRSEFYGAGDIDGNEAVDLGDAILGLQILSGVDTGNKTIIIDADVNKDGRIGIEDIVYILQKIAGMR